MKIIKEIIMEEVNEYILLRYKELELCIIEQGLYGYVFEEITNEILGEQE